jgi:hypothetical protein
MSKPMMRSSPAMPAVRAALQAEQECAPESACRVRELKLQEAVGHETVRIVSGYEAELAAVRARPSRSVRLCRAAGAGDVRGAGPAGAADATGPSTGVVSGTVGRDLGPDLYQLARDADEVAARLRALQEWNVAISRPPDP